jgi:purine-binding chemotaxis protein CheW
MTILEEGKTSAIHEEVLSLCLLVADEEVFGIDTYAIREVLGPCRPRLVPLMPDYIGGIVSYRGEVLTTVSLRALLGRPEESELSHVVVLDDRESGEHFGLLVDAVPGVLQAERRSVVPSPPSPEERSAFLFQGVVQRPEGLVIQLAAERLSPTSLRESAIFGRPVAPVRFLPIKVKEDSQAIRRNEHEMLGQIVGDVA